MSSRQHHIQNSAQHFGCHALRIIDVVTQLCNIAAVILLSCVSEKVNVGHCNTLVLVSDELWSLLMTFQCILTNIYRQHLFLLKYRISDLKFLLPFISPPL